MGQGTNGKKPQGLPVAKTTTYTTFSYSVAVREDGVRQLILTTLDGNQQVFPFTPENANDVSRQMAGPSVAMPGDIAQTG